MKKIFINTCKIPLFIISGIISLLSYLIGKIYSLIKKSKPRKGCIDQQIERNDCVTRMEFIMQELYNIHLLNKYKHLFVEDRIVSQSEMVNRKCEVYLPCNHSTFPAIILYLS